MDTITHTLFGLALYGTIDKQGMDRSHKRALLFTAVVGSQIPDIDVISQLWDTQGMYQMWHRGLTHSALLVPVWALLIWLICRWIWKVKDWKGYALGLLAVFIHDTSDLFNAWGTGYFEPVSQARITFGTIPIVDLVFWAILLAAWLTARFGRRKAPRVYRAAWLLMLLHVFAQSVQGYGVYQAVKPDYDHVALAASFVPGQFQVIGKRAGTVDIAKATAWTKPELVHRLESSEDADLDYLFENNPKARTLYQWSPFVVVVDEEEQIAIYDPRFYRNGQSFLFEAAAKAK